MIKLYNKYGQYTKEALKIVDGINPIFKKLVDKYHKNCNIRELELLLIKNITWACILKAINKLPPTKVKKKGNSVQKTTKKNR